VSEESGKRLVVVVCTGNICRSPMGEAFLRAHLADRGVTDIEVSSAGTHAQTGRGAMPEARAAVDQIRGDASSHVAAPLDIGLAQEAGLILCAAHEHRDYIQQYWAQLSRDKVRMFNEAIEGEAPLDVEDPYGWDAGVFMLAARVIDGAMGAWADKLAEGWWPDTDKG